MTAHRAKILTEILEETEMIKTDKDYTPNTVTA
jgi:hypothetical protein